MILAILIAAADEPASSQLAVFKPLVGHCWSATIAKDTVDRHCFTAMYGGAHVRDDHVVKASGREVYSGSTIYSVEGEALTLTYYNSMGGVGRGSAKSAGPDVQFTMTMRARPGDPPAPHKATWRIGPDGYTVTNAGGTHLFVRDD